jgi:hypothetical protein
VATLQLSTAGEWRWLASRDRVNVLDVAVGLVLSVDGVLIVTGVLDGHGRVSIVPALGVLAMTLPVIWRRRWSVAIAVILGAAAVLNCLVIGRMVRCGAALPALLLAAYALGRQPHRRPRWALGLGFGALLVSATLQCFYDPRLDPSVLCFMVPVLVGLLAAGMLIESRSALVERLRARNDELRRGRERIATLAMEADRARIATNLGGWLTHGIDGMEHAARRGIGALIDDDPATARAAFDTIGEEGRGTLQRLRRAVGTLLEAEGSAEPQPTLRQLDRLSGDSDRIRIVVGGDCRALSPALELSGYRTVELLLGAFEATSRDPVRVDVDFGADTLELRVRGRVVSRSEETSALAAARTRVALFRGTLSIERWGGESEVIARVPVGVGA